MMLEQCDRLAQHTGVFHGFDQDEQSGDERKHAPRNLLEHGPGRGPSDGEDGNTRGSAREKGREAELEVEGRGNQENDSGCGNSDACEPAARAQGRQSDLTRDAFPQFPALGPAQHAVGNGNGQHRGDAELLEPGG